MKSITLTNPRFVYEFQKPLRRPRVFRLRHVGLALLSGMAAAILLLA